MDVQESSTPCHSLTSLTSLSGSCPSYATVNEISETDVFESEDGTRKCFSEFANGEVFKHVHNGVPERTASAHVFLNGFHCFGCGETYYVKETMELEEFDFYENEVYESSDPAAYMPDIDWG